MIDYGELYQSYEMFSQPAHRLWPQLNILTVWHGTSRKKRAFFFEQISGSYGALSLSGECCRCAFVRRSYSIWTNTKWLSACCTVIILEVWCSLTVKKCSFPSINKLIKPLLGSITAYLSGNSEVAVVEMSHCKHKNKWFSSVAVLCL